MRLRFLILFTGFYLNLAAQATTGFKLGITMNSVKGIKGTSHFLPGYEAGFYSKGDFNDLVTFLAEADYAVKRTEIKSDEISSNLELSYFTARFAGGLNLGEQFYVAFGPYFSYMIKAKQSSQLVNDDYFGKFAVGLNPTLGFETIRFSFILRYDWGLTFLTLESLPEAKNNVLEGARFNGFEFIAGVKF